MKENTNEKNGYIKNIFYVLGLLLLIVVFFKGYHNSFDKKVHLGGDNASYYSLGKAIASGHGYVNIQNSKMSKHNHYPAGYPLIIAATSKLFSDKITTIKKANVFFFFMSVVFLFLIIHKLTGNYYISFITCLFTLLNYNLLTYSVIMMSEIPFMFFATLCIWLYLKVDFSLPVIKNGLFFILLICISFTYHIRSTGLALFVGIAFVLLLKKNWKYLATYVGGFFLLGLPWYLRSQSLGGSSYMKQLIRKNPYRPELGQMELMDWVERIWTNFERHITKEIPSGVFNFITPYTPGDATVLSEWIIGLSIVLIMIFGIIKIKKHSLLILFYILSTFGILMLWPSQWFGVRFLLPLVPVLTFLFIYGAVEILIWVINKVFKFNKEPVIYISCVVLSLLFIKSYAKEPFAKLKEQAESPYHNSYKNYFELATWVKKNTSENSITASRKGPLFYLYSNKFVTRYKDTLDKEEQINSLKEKGVDYVVLEQLGYSSTARYLYPAIQRYPEKFKVVKHLGNPDTYLMKFLPELGYWGEWKNDKKEGKGTYVWENNQKFVGEWKDDLRNGKGTLYYSDGSYLEATWVNDLIEGEVVLMSNTNQVIEKSVYKNNVKVMTDGHE